MAIDLIQFRQSLNYQSSAPISELLADWQTIADFDKLVAANQRRYNLILGLALLLSLGGGILVTNSVVWVGWLLLAIGIGGLVYAGTMSGRYARLNLVNARYELLRQVLELVKRDMDAATPLQVQINFTAALDVAKKSETVPHPTRQGWKIDRFIDPWLSLSGKFLDGTHFSLKLTELSSKQYGWKRGRSGKSKYKSKVKSKGELELLLNCPRKKYGAMTLLQSDATAAIQLPPGAQLKQLKMTENRLLLVVKLPAWFGKTQPDKNLYQTITMMFLSLYQILNLARLLSKSNA
jgi:hypothetical protein